MMMDIATLGQIMFLFHNYEILFYQLYNVNLQFILMFLHLLYFSNNVYRLGSSNFASLFSCSRTLIFLQGLVEIFMKFHKIFCCISTSYETLSAIFPFQQQAFQSISMPMKIIILFSNSMQNDIFYTYLVAEPAPESFPCREQCICLP